MFYFVQTYNKENNFQNWYAFFLYNYLQKQKKIRKMKKNIQIIWELIKKYVSLHQNKEKRNFN